jgi:CBS domain-containing protein
VVEEEVPVREVVRQMRDRALCSATVTKQEKLSGLFTESDLLLKVLGKEGALDLPVAEVMTRDPVRVRETDPVRRVVYEMRELGHRNVPVVDEEGRVVACLRQRDVVRWMTQHFAQQALNLPPDPGKVATSREGA